MAPTVDYRRVMPVFDDSQFPLMQIRVPETWEEARVLELFDVFEQVASREEPCALLMDLRGSSLPPPNIRKLLGEKRKTLKPFFDAHLIAEAALVSSAALKGFLSLMNWLAPSEHPQKTFENEERARTWLKARLAEASATSAAG